MSHLKKFSCWVSCLHHLRCTTQRVHPGTTQEDTSIVCAAMECKPHNPPILWTEVVVKYPLVSIACYPGGWGWGWGVGVEVGVGGSLFFSLVAQWVRVFFGFFLQFWYPYRHRPLSDRHETAPLTAQRPQVSCARCRPATATAPLAASNSTDTTAFATGYIACTVHMSLNIALQTTWLCT